MEQKFIAHADEARRLAQTARREADRQFWLNVARAWVGLVTCLPKKKSDGWFRKESRE
jgi:hypothetical protein